MVLTPDAANKMLRNLEEQKTLLNKQIDNYATYVVAITEGNPEELKPDFNFESVVAEIDNIDRQITSIKHARNKFNSETRISEDGLTIDMALMRLAMYQAEYRKYRSMGNVQPKERVNDRYNSKEIEYRYVNYDIGFAKRLSEEIFSSISEIQTQIDLVNATKTFEVKL